MGFYTIYSVIHMGWSLKYLRNHLTAILPVKMTDSILRRLALVKSVFGDLVINEIEIPPGHYLSHPQTVQLMKSEFVYPEIADRRLPDIWQKEGSKTIYE